MPAHSRPAAIVFDLGEVLLRLDFSRLFRELRFEKGTQVSGAMEALGRWQLYDRFERGAFEEDEFRTQLEASLGQRYAPEVFRELWNSVIVGAVPGVEALLETLRSQVPLYALSNSNAIHMRHVRASYPWLGTLNAVYSSHELGARKPEPLIYQKTLAAVGVPAPRVLFIDDRPENVAGARALGMQGELCRRTPDDLVEILRRYGFAHGQ